MCTRAQNFLGRVHMCIWVVSTKKPWFKCIHVREKNSDGGESAKIKTGVRKTRFFRLKTGFFGYNFAKMLKTIKKGLRYTENSEKSLFFGKFHPLRHPSTFFNPLEGGGNPPPPNPPTPMYVQMSTSRIELVFWRNFIIFSTNDEFP